MASISKYARNEQRKIAVKEQSTSLISKKKTLVLVCKKSTYEKIIANIKNKINETTNSDMKNKLKNELTIYENKVKSIPEFTNKEKWALQFEINTAGRQLKRVAVRSRCSIPTCARPRGVIKKFGLCRLHIKEMICHGLLPGHISQRSW